MSAEHAKDAAGKFVSDLKLPEKMAEATFQLATFANEKDCRFFYPRRALDWQRQVTTYVSRIIRQRKIRVQRIMISPSDYHAWRGGRDDTERLRRQFVDEHQRLI